MALLPFIRGAEPRELGKVIEHAAHAFDIPHDDAKQLLTRRLSELWKLPKHLRRAHGRANSIPQFVRERAIERAQPFLLLVDASLHAGEILIGRRLLNERDRVK